MLVSASSWVGRRPVWVQTVQRGAKSHLETPQRSSLEYFTANVLTFSQLHLTFDRQQARDDISRELLPSRGTNECSAARHAPPVLRDAKGECAPHDSMFGLASIRCFSPIYPLRH